MRTTFLILSSFGLACTSTPSQSARDTPEDRSAASNEAPASAPVPASAPTPEQPKPSATITPAVREAGVPAPASKDILALARAAGLEAPASAAKPEPFGPRRHVAIVRTREGADPASFALHLLVLALPESTAAAEPIWTLASHAKLFTWQREWLDDAEAGSIPTSIFVDDYEDDGELELMVRFRNEIMCPGGGPNEITTLLLVEANEQPPRIALSTEVDHAIVSTKTKATLNHEDLDGDGHRDLRIVYRTSSEGEQSVEAERRWVWDQASDGWTRSAAEGTWTDHAREGCDW